VAKRAAKDGKANGQERDNEGGSAASYYEASWQVVLRPVHNLWRLVGEPTDVHARDGCGLALLVRCRVRHSCKNVKRGGGDVIASSVRIISGQVDDPWFLAATLFSPWLKIEKDGRSPSCNP
jgi:hypothetical protein